LKPVASGIPVVLAKVYLSVIIPARNEAERLPKTLKRFHEYLAATGFTYEIVVVLDGPCDHTRAALRETVREIARLKIIDRAENRGKGFTVREGIAEACGQIRLFADADNSTDIAHFDRMKPLLDDGCDLVIASRNRRDAPGAEQALPQALYKRVIGQFGNLFVQLIAVPGIWDTQCGFKAFRADAAQRIFSQTKIDGWGFDIEVLALAHALNCKLGIIPVRWINDPGSHFVFLDYFRVLRDTLKVRYNMITGKYAL
jgi:dolichyl-phosphate beta-glucosyltransferase